MQRRPVCPDDRQVGQGIGADNAEWRACTVGEERRAVLRAPDDVRVGQQEAVGCVDDRRSEPLAAVPTAARRWHPQARHPRC